VRFRAHGTGSRCRELALRGQNLVYFRSVYINGELGSHGLVCQDLDEPTFKYLGMDLVADSIADASCVPVERYYGTEYELYLEGVGDGDA
jgi:hypothetical protein